MSKPLVTAIEPSEWILPNMVAYVPQQAWLQNASIKENIIFSSPWEGEWDFMEFADEQKRGIVMSWTLARFSQISKYLKMEMKRE